MGAVQSNDELIHDPSEKVYNSGLADKRWEDKGKWEWTDVDTVEWGGNINNYKCSTFDISNKIIHHIQRTGAYLKLINEKIFGIEGNIIYAENYTYLKIECSKVLIHAFINGNSTDFCSISKRVSMRNILLPYDKITIDKWNFIPMLKRGSDIKLNWNSLTATINSETYPITFDKTGDIIINNITYYRIFNNAHFVAISEGTYCYIKNEF